jgi:hypothetical protein
MHEVLHAASVHGEEKKADKENTSEQISNAIVLEHAHGICNTTPHVHFA